MYPDVPMAFQKSGAVLPSGKGSGLMDIKSKKPLSPKTMKMRPSNEATIVEAIFIPKNVVAEGSLSEVKKQGLEVSFDLKINLASVLDGKRITGSETVGPNGDGAMNDL